jgi:hypothetical protein
MQSTPIKPAPVPYPPKGTAETKTNERFQLVGNTQKKAVMRLTGFGKKRRGRTGKTTSSVPPTLETAPAVTQVFRFATTSGTTVSPTVAQLILVPGFICAVVNSTAYSLASCIKINSIKIWTAASGGAEVSWLAASGYAKDDSKDSQIPTGMTAGSGPYVTRPPRKSLAGDWLAPSLTTQTPFSISCTTGSIIDVSLSFVLSNNIAPQSVTIATGAVGSLYYGYLDGPTSHLYVPQGRPSTF